MIKKQSMLFPESEVTVISELDLKEAEEIVAQVKAAVETLCERLAVAGSIRRQKSKVHDIDFVVVTKNDVEWQKINEKLKKLKAKPNCSGNSLIKDSNIIAGETEKGVFEALGLFCPLPSEREIVDGKPVWMPPEKL